MAIISKTKFSRLLWSDRLQGQYSHFSAAEKHFIKLQLQRIKIKYPCFLHWLLQNSDFAHSMSKIVGELSRNFFQNLE